MRLLVACYQIVLNGGLLRFDRFAAAIRGWGHEVAFTCMAEHLPADRATDVPVLPFAQAASMQWDAVMVPGAGFPMSDFPRFSALRAPNFGVRVQHILNDPTQRAAFKAMNDVVAPHIVIFNNDHWPPGSYTEFAADRFHVLVGAVDTERFRPVTDRPRPLDPGRWIIGGLVKKNPEPLIEALALLPASVSMRLYGPDTDNVRGRHADLPVASRIVFAGPLVGNDLCRFYHGVDCVVSTETQAGWCNLGAEALASGVPLICTPHGTIAFARHDTTALIIDEPTPTAIAQAVTRLRTEFGLCRRLAEAGRDAISSFSWDAYARRLLAILQHDGERHYTYAPEYGRFGKWPLSERLSGLENLLAASKGASILDLGAAEGLVGLQFLKSGARLLHGFELDAQRVKFANRICAQWPQAAFRAADVADYHTFQSRNRDLLLDQYDIVLYLGLHQHLSPSVRRHLLKRAAGLARRYLAVRTPAPIFEGDAIEDNLRRAGFASLDAAVPTNRDSAVGICRIYRRVAEAVA